MKILYCHNYYRIRGGEDVSFEADVQMLRDYGHEVITLTRDNANLSDSSLLRTTKQLFWNRETEKEAESLIRQHRPDVLHCNNLFPQISPSVYRAANRANVPVVQAIRNYRYFCSGGTFYRNGQVCTDCVGKSVAYPAVLHGCYRNSRPGSALVAAMHAYHRSMKTWSKRVSMFFTPSQFAKETCIVSGFSRGQIKVKTNFVYPDHGPGPGDGGFALFIGRLTKEKGTETIAEAWMQRNPPLPLKIVGEGEISDFGKANGQVPNVEMLGQQPMEHVLELLGRATCLIFPSRWYETFGRTIAEAFSRGTPVISSDMGVMADHVEHGENGLLFPAGNAHELVRQIEKLVEDPAQTQRMRENARQRFLDRFTRQHSYDQLLDIYEAAGVPSLRQSPNLQQVS